MRSRMRRTDIENKKKTLGDSQGTGVCKNTIAAVHRSWFKDQKLKL